MKLENVSFIGLLVLVTLAFFGLLWDLAQPIFWAATLTVLFRSTHRRILGWVSGRRSTASGLTVLLILVTVILPTWFVGAAVLDEAEALFVRARSGEIDPAPVVDWVTQRLPIVGERLAVLGVTPEELKANLSAWAVGASRFLGTRAVAVGQNALRFTVLLFLMLYVLFFFLRDGDRIIEQLVHALPIGDDRERRLIRKLAEVARATVKGTLVIGLVQGALGGAIFAMLGIQGAVFWGVVMVILSLIPVVGASFVWAPAALIMLASGAYAKAVVLVLFGALVIGLVDNLLRPLLVGRDTRMPDYLVLLSTLGGLSVFGASGIIVGPAIAALFLTLWMMFAEEHTGTSVAPAFLSEEAEAAEAGGAES